MFETLRYFLWKLCFHFDTTVLNRFAISFGNCVFDGPEPLMGDPISSPRTAGKVGPNLDKTPGVDYTFNHEIALRNDLLGRVLQSPEKQFPINYGCRTIACVMSSYA